MTELPTTADFCKVTAEHLYRDKERVQQLTGPRFWATVLDWPAVGHDPSKRLGYFWWIKF